MSVSFEKIAELSQCLAVDVGVLNHGEGVSVVKVGQACEERYFAVAVEE